MSANSNKTRLSNKRTKRVASFVGTQNQTPPTYLKKFKPKSISSAKGKNKENTEILIEDDSC